MRPRQGETAAELAGEVVSRMTLVEELDVVTLLSTKAYENSTTPVPGLCIPALTMQDGPSGLAYGDTGVTQFPAPIAVAASFDPSVAYAVGRAIGTEAHAQGVAAVQGPYLNLARVPQAGRVFEGFGEDPALTAAMGVADVRGIQSAGVLADAKDLGVYTQETNRDFLDQIVTARALEELYLAPFRAVVQQGDVASLMCGFGRIDSVVTCEDAAVLREVRSWGFAGFFRDDINAAPDTGAALAAGLDLFKPAPWKGDAHRAMTASDRRAIAGAARAVLTEMFRFGLVQHPLAGRTSVDVRTARASRAALAAAERGAVLLKDAGGTLPIAPSVPSIAVIGAGANVRPITAGGGSSAVVTVAGTTPLGAIRRAWPSTRIFVAEGEPAVPAVPELPPRDVSPALPAVPPPPAHPVYHTSAPPSGTWRTWSGALTPPVSGLYELSVRSHGDTEVSLGGRVVLDDPGAHGPTTVGLPEQLVAGRHYAMSMRWLEYDENVPKIGWQDVSPTIAAAAAAASRAAVAVVFVGATRTEGADATSLALAGVEDQLVEAVAAANPATVVVVDSGGPVLMPWLGEVRGVIEAWYPGEQGARAIAALLGGAVDPAGRLPVSFPRSPASTSVSASPSLWPGLGYTVSTNAGGGGLDVGYRYYDARGVPVLFPFGFGLSYTTFSLARLRVRRDAEGYVASLRVTNTGSRAGSEVVEAYLHYPATADEPPIGLKAFATVALAPGAARTVTLDLPRTAFTIWGPRGTEVVPGRYVVEVGTSSDDLPLRAALAVP
ncbi:MAG TPA: glycoside hydrolase family 3 C-terminal domain-containing protein [Acidimicrobiales bacterium]|nr:glycoside hydrolase family 3 C-terminal domain-containing protein [Acidimicrobiales bacterium]